MATKTIAWPNGTGSITATYDGSGDGTITITSDPNNLYENRSAQITVSTTDGSDITRTITVQQAAKVRIDISSAVVTAADQTYSGSALTPVPTVILNGSTIPSSGYDVAYSNNTNAGTATITITGKGDYTGTTTGTFTIAKASRTISFANTYYVQNTSTTTTRTATPSAGSSDGAITYSISSTTYATINSSSGAVTSKTSDGSATVTATIAEGTNYLSASGSYTLYVFATTHNYSYSGSYSSVSLPPGSYKLQCWGAQGGSNSADSTYGIIARDGGAGGYSEGVLTISSPTTVYVFVGGQGSSSGNGGWNCGGGSSGSGTYTSGNTTVKGYWGCGGGATDIALTSSTMTYSSKRNNRSNASLLSRFIVAGGGSGGVMACSRVTSTTITRTVNGSDIEDLYSGYINASGTWTVRSAAKSSTIDVTANRGQTLTITSGSFGSCTLSFLTALPNTTSGASQSFATGYSGRVSISGTSSVTVPSDAVYFWVYTINSSGPTDVRPSKLEFSTITTTDTTNGYGGGFGGGIRGGGNSSTYWGTQNSAGTNAAFGLGANADRSTYGASGPGGGAGWYGGGNGASQSDISYIARRGGGSGFVNTAESAGNRPSGYTGLQLDSGTTYDGVSSFPSTSGSTEAGHSGNGYAKITRLS